ncbi:LANO_0H10132g1_1 [Lachancea nothofagi CBS 11611]|uniref:Ribonuclease H2 subunit B n=1 Tax=Lachancea nothofagi CBS 11611 TaxID=1266666 RepID=A0A1G4KMA1_9SACH|nr:LANO_0H10132g1_1 [Lachancea nothofagi CBS 11611]
MTVSQTIPERIIALPKGFSGGELKIFELPHSSNIESKKPVRVFVHNGTTYQLKKKAFSQGCEYHRARDSANEKYRYTADSKPLKSGILTNAAQRQDGWLLQSGTFEFSTKYDLCFSLCGAFYSDFACKDENQFQQVAPSVSATSLENRFLMARDFHDNLIEKHSTNWSHVPLETLRDALTQLSESIEEAGDIYHNVTPAKVTQWLVGKVRKIIDGFPASVPLPRNLPEEIHAYAKITFACNLLISLVPRPAYQNLTQYAGSDLNIAKAIQDYNSYQTEAAARQKEQELLIDSAMKVGMSNGNGNKPAVKKVTKVVKTKKIGAGKGAIDGFFRKKK